jgi:hypothetical protein
VRVSGAVPFPVNLLATAGVTWLASTTLVVTFRRADA